MIANYFNLLSNYWKHFTTVYIINRKHERLSRSLNPISSNNFLEDHGFNYQKSSIFFFILFLKKVNKLHPTWAKTYATRALYVVGAFCQTPFEL